MELQGLQEALKVEIQCHQDGELKKQLHDRHPRITSLSEKQCLCAESLLLLLEAAGILRGNGPVCFGSSCSLAPSLLHYE
ncbi:unnamed protein product [Gadus morhua 'NCC']